MVCSLAVQIHAQKACVVASAEDHVPIREALIRTNNNHWARTDYRGYWTMKYQFDSATVSKSGFLKTTVYLKELPDTVFLLPESRQLGTVEVWGKNQEHIKNMEEQVKNAAGCTPQQGGASFDLANMLDRRGRRDHRHLKNAKKILDDYDRKDPIVAAYEQATGKKYELKTLKELEIQDSNLVSYKGIKITKEQRKIEQTSKAVNKSVEVFDAMHKGTPVILKREEE